MIFIRPAKTDTRAQIVGLTPLEIVERAQGLWFTSQYVGNYYFEKPVNAGKGFDPHQRDFEKPALIMYGSDILFSENELVLDFIYATEMFITDINSDTIAFVPKHIIDEARIAIKAAFEERNFNEIYRLFDEAFVFLPISK